MTIYSQNVKSSITASTIDSRTNNINTKIIVGRNILAIGPYLKQLVRSLSIKGDMGRRNLAHISSLFKMACRIFRVHNLSFDSKIRIAKSLAVKIVGNLISVIVVMRSRVYCIRSTAVHVSAAFKINPFLSSPNVRYGTNFKSRPIRLDY